MGAEEKKTGEFDAVMTVARVTTEPDAKLGIPCRRVRLSGTSSLASMVWAELLVQGPGAEIFAAGLEPGDGFDVHVRMREIGGDDFARHARRMVERANAARKCGCEETYPQLQPGRVNHHPECANYQAKALGEQTACTHAPGAAQCMCCTLPPGDTTSPQAIAKDAGADGDGTWRHGPGFEVVDDGAGRRELTLQVGGGFYTVEGGALDVFELAAVLRLQHRRIAALEAKVAKATEDAKNGATAAKEMRHALGLVDGAALRDKEALRQIERACDEFKAGAEKLAAELSAPERLP